MSQLTPRTWTAFAILGVAVLYVVWQSIPYARLSAEQQNTLLGRAGQALIQGEFDVAELHLQRLSVDENVPLKAYALTAQLAAYRRDYGRMREALSVFKARNDIEFEARFKCSKILIDQGMLSDAMAILSSLVLVAPPNLAAINETVRLLRMAGRNRESLPLIRILIDHSEVQAIDLRLMCRPVFYWATDADRDFLMEKRSLGASDPLLDLAFGHFLFHEHRLEQSLVSVNRSIAADSSVLSAWVIKGLLLVELGQFSELSMWNAQLPVSTENEPEVWLARGLWMQRVGRTEQAVACFLQSIQLADNASSADVFYQLSRSLHVLGQSELASLTSKRAQSLSTLSELVTSWSAIKEDPETLRTIVSALKSQGRHREAAAWCDIARREMPSADWIGDVQATLDETQKTQSDGTIASLAVQLSTLQARFPPDSFAPPVEEIVLNTKKGGDSTDTHLRFEDRADEASVNFTFHNGADRNVGRAYMFEFSGPGIGITDLDADGWPDIYLTQGAPWPVTADQTVYRNRLFRNLGNGTFEEAAEVAQVDDNGYGQGVGVGDVNNDGFDDLYICNIGTNVLFQNNGDGTFIEVQSAVNSEFADWSISSIICDLNTDGSPDIFLANYLSGNDVFERACVSSGVPVQCFPQSFPPAQDRILIASGDGDFEDCTVPSGFTTAGCKSMGAIAAVIGESRMGVFVANDTMPNRLFVHASDTRDGPPDFLESGTELGVALDERGQSQSSMGAAAGDVNGDGLLDFFVTNFAQECNNLFIQQLGGTFIDESGQRGLNEAAIQTEGWGTQLLDGDLDGDLDLFVANGHLSDYPGAKFGKMPQHLFRNQLGQFIQVDDAEAGDYFSKSFLGRSAATLDWDRNGREDLCVTHVKSPVALLANVTKNAGHFAGFRLTGTECSRDAIGAILTAYVGDKKFVRFLSAGGYASASQQRINFGTGSNQRISRLEVRWPDGSTENYHELPVDQEYHCVQSGGLHRLPAPAISGQATSTYLTQ